MQRFISNSLDNYVFIPPGRQTLASFLNVLGSAGSSRPDGRHYAQVRNANLNIWCVCALTALGPGTTHQ